MHVIYNILHYYVAINISSCNKCMTCSRLVSNCSCSSSNVQIYWKMPGCHSRHIKFICGQNTFCAKSQVSPSQQIHDSKWKCLTNTYQIKTIKEGKQAQHRAAADRSRHKSNGEFSTRGHIVPPNV